MTKGRIRESYKEDYQKFTTPIEPNVLKAHEDSAGIKLETNVFKAQKKYG